MDAAKIKRAEEVFQIVVELPVEERVAVLDQRCAGDAELRVFVDRLLSHDAAGMGEFMCRPVFTPLLHETAGTEGSFPERIGHYETVRVLGEGGMGVVYEARQENPPRTVALKVIRAGFPSTNMLRRFQHEAEMLGQLQHPGIACIYEAGVAEIAGEGGIVGRQPFFAMELIHGKPLHKYAAENNPTPRERLELVATICDAVHHAHQKGVIHRDLKPANILIDESGHPKILDFGVARATNADVLTITMHTAVGQLIGTVPYMSPEQVTADTRLLDTRSDVYALGVILYELLSGKLPHDVRNRSIPEAARIIRDEEPSRLSSFDPRFRGDIETIVAKACEKSKDRRYPSAAELAADLRRYLRDEPIVARQPSRMYHLGKFAKRNKGLVGGLAAALVALLLGLIGTTAGMLEAAAQRDDAVAASQEANAVNRFLQEMLGSVDPRQTKNRELTVREVLDQAAREIDGGSFANQPGVEAALRTTIGTTYRELGHYAEAEPHLRQALTIRCRVLGDEHPDVASALNNLGQLLILRADYDRAEPFLREALAIRRALLGHEHVRVADSLHNLALLLLYKGDDREAERLNREALAMRRKLLRDDHPYVAKSLSNLAYLLRLRGDYAAAEPLYRDALAINRKQLGDDHLEVGLNLHNLALLLHYQGDYAAAEPLYRQALAIRRTRLGNDHPAIASGLNALAGLLQMKGDYAAAEPLFREALELRRRRLGDHHPKVATVIGNLATVLRAKGQFAAAARLHREALSILRKALPADHPDVANQLIGLGAALLDQGKPAEAELLLREGLDICRATLPRGHARIVEAERLLGRCLTTAGESRQADAQLLWRDGAAIDSNRKTTSRPHDD